MAVFHSITCNLETVLFSRHYVVRGPENSPYEGENTPVDSKKKRLIKTIIDVEKLILADILVNISLLPGRCYTVNSTFKIDPMMYVYFKLYQYFFFN